MNNKFEELFGKFANKDYKLAYDAVRAALACCPTILVMMNDKMIQKTDVANEMKIGGVPIVKDDGECEFTLASRGKSGSYILIVYDRKMDAFRCAVGKTSNYADAKFFKVSQEDIYNFFYEATMV